MFGPLINKFLPPFTILQYNWFKAEVEKLNFPRSPVISIMSQLFSGAELKHHIPVAAMSEGTETKLK